MPHVRAHERRRPYEAEYRRTHAELHFGVLMRDLDKNIIAAMGEVFGEIEREDREQAERIREAW